MTRHPTTRAVVRRTVLTTPLLSLFLVLVVGGLAFLAVRVPALVDQVRTATVRHQIIEIPDISRPLTAGQPWIAGIPRGETAPRRDVWAAPLDALEAQRTAQPRPLRDLLGAPRAVGIFGAVGLEGERTTPRNIVQLVMDPGLEQRSRLVQGAYPRVTDPEVGVEIVLTERSAAELDWRIGEVRHREGLAVTLVGLVAPNGTEELDWDMLVGSRAPLSRQTPMGDVILQTVGFLAPDEAGQLGERLAQTSTFAWIPLDASRVSAADATTVSAQLRLLLADPVHVGSGDDVDRGLQFASPVADALDQGAERADALTAVITVSAVGPLAVAAVMLVLAARQIVWRRSRAAALARARGASLAQLSVVLGAEALLLGAAGAAIGVAAGAAFSARGPDLPVLLLVLVLVLVPACAVVFTVAAGLRRSERRDGDPAGRRPWRRLLVETVLVAFAVALAVILQSRGPLPRVDPVLLAAPLVVGAVGTVVALRALPLLLRGLHRAAGHRIGLIALVGPARALRDATLRTAPALAAVVGMAVAVFAVSFAATVSDGIGRHARDVTGADVAVSMPYIEDAQIEAVKKVAGVEAVATLDADEIGEGASPGVSDRVRIYAVDRNAFVRVQQGFAGALPLPSALTSSGGAVPVVASEQLLAQFGDDFTVNGNEVRVVGRTAQSTPFGNAQKWVIVDRANIDRIGVASPVVTRLLASISSAHDPRAVAEAVEVTLGGDATVTTVDQLIAQAGSDPASSALRVALLVAAAIVVVLVAVCIVQTLLLGTTARARLLALLRAVGYPRRRELPLVAWEVVPVLVVALPVGVLAGIVTSWLVIGGLDLRGFTGGHAGPVLSLPVGGLAVAMLGFVAVTAVAVLLVTITAMRLRSADAIRVGDDEG